MIFLLILYTGFILGSGFALFFPEYYSSELILSFLPYSIVISFLGLIMCFFLLKWNKYKKKYIYQSPIIRFRCSLLIFLGGIIFFMYSKKFTYFYHFPVPQIKQNMTGGLKVLYANIYKNNTDYTGIQNAIENQNPDILLFVEFADHHYKHLQPFLSAHYPYSNSTHRSHSYVGNMVFSKIKIENWADDFPQGARRYAYFSIQYNNNPIYFYLVHMSSPITEKYFHMRNTQIASFFKDFSLHQESHRKKHDKVLVVGDFNTSPWSVFYWNFAQGFSGEFVNITRSFPILFTWNALDVPLLWSHIDHIFANKQLSFSKLQTLNITGSDHRGYSFLIK